MGSKVIRTALIPSGSASSQVIDLLDYDVVGFKIPSAMTGTYLTIQSSDTKGGTYTTVQDGEGADLTFQVTVSKTIPIPNYAFIGGLRYIKVVSNATEAARRNIKVITSKL